MSKGLPHILTALLRNGLIDGARDSDVFEAMLTERAAVEASLRQMGLQLAVDVPGKAAIAMVMTENQLDDMAEQAGLDPIEPVFATRRQGYWESCALVIFRIALDREIHGSGQEMWHVEADIVEAIKSYYPESYRDNDVSMTARVKTILETLEKRHLIDRRSSGGNVLWRGSRWLGLALTRDATQDFEARCNALVVAAEKARTVWRPSSPQDCKEGCKEGFEEDGEAEGGQAA